MARGFLAEIVRADTEDDITLTGMVIHPTVSPAKSVPIVWVHGYTGSFHEDTASRMGQEFAARGYTFVCGDNRGHDFGVVLRKKGPEYFGQETWLGGAGWEKFRESVYDVAAWVSFAESLGFPEIILLGHSYGGTKVVNYMGKRQDSRVKGLVAASPGARVHEVWHNPEVTKLAQQLVAEGRGEVLISLNPYGPSREVSAAAYLDRLQANVDVFGFSTPDAPVTSIRCPILAFYGAKEEWIGGPDTLEFIRKQAKACPRIETRLFAGADHWYQGTDKVIAEAIANWVEGL